MKLKPLLLAMMCSASFSAAYADSFLFSEHSVDVLKKDNTGAYVVGNVTKIAVKTALSAKSLAAAGFDTAAFHDFTGNAATQKAAAQTIGLTIGSGTWDFPANVFSAATKHSIKADRFTGYWTVKEDEVIKCATQQADYDTDVGVDKTALQGAQDDLVTANTDLTDALASDPKADVTAEKDEVATQKANVAAEQKTYNDALKLALATTAGKKADTALKTCQKGLATLAKINVIGDVKSGLALSVAGSSKDFVGVPALGLCTTTGKQDDVATISIGATTITFPLTVNCSVSTKASQGLDLTHIIANGKDTKK